MTAKTTSIVAYVSFAGWILAFCSGDKDGAKFHLNQALILSLGSMINSVLSIWGGIFSFLTPIISLVLFVFWLMGFIDACKGNETPLPLIGDIHILK